MAQASLTQPTVFSRRVFARRTATLLTATLAAITVGTPASASPGSGPDGAAMADGQSKVRFSANASQGAKNTIKSAYAAGRGQRSQGESVRRQFLARAANESGIYYDANSVDYLKLERSDNAKYRTVELVVPRNYEVKAVGLSESRQRSASGKLEERVSASVEGAEHSSSVVTMPDGPGFASFKPDGSGQWLLKTSVGELLATWNKEKMTDSGQPYYYFSYQRKGRADTWDIPGKDFGIQHFGIQSSPENPMNHWRDRAPATGTRNGDCRGPAVSLPLTLFGATTSIQYQDCEKHTIGIVADEPGTMWVDWNHGLSYPSGTREVAFNWIAANNFGTGLWVNDWQQVEFYRVSDEAYEECRSQNSNDCIR